MSIYFSRDKQSVQPHLEPFQLQYQAIPDTPKSSKTSVPGTPTMPVAPPSSAISPASSSSLTPGMQSMNIGRGRGRPQKQLIEPSMEDFPEHGTGDEKHRWLKMKVTELWRYNMLTSDQSAGKNSGKKKMLVYVNTIIRGRWQKLQQLQDNLLLILPPQVQMMILLTHRTKLEKKVNCSK